ncbi:MAG: tetratricopeptide repeat protein, partial [Planctomycetes bacterium]|nr:tetratricopeptide repeat protein [Planctomycetota bacterium]
TAPVVGVLLLLGHLAIAAAPVALLFVWKQGRLLALGVLGFYVSLAPLSCLIEGMRLLRFSEDVDFPVSERFLYLPSFYLCLVLAWLIAYQLPRWIPGARGPAVGALLAVVVAASAWADHRRAVDWYDDYHLFQSGVRTNPVSVRMSNNLGFELMQNWEIKRARQQLLRCTNLVSKYHERRTPMPQAFQNLGHSYYLQGEFHNAVEYYRKSFQYDPKNAVAANNLGALMGIFGSITMNIELILEGFRCYERAVELAPNYVFAKSSKDFMRKVFLTWQRYLHAGDRDPNVVASFGNSFFQAARSISESDDPKYLQAMQILDSGLKFMPSDAEMEKIFPELVAAPAAPAEGETEPADDKPKMHEIKKDMADRFALCFERGIRQYERLLERKAAQDPAEGARNPALNFLLGEVYRVGWRRTQSPEHRTKAQRHFEITLAGEPEHPGATRGMVELLRAEEAHEEAVNLAAATVDALLIPERLWEEDVPDPTPQPRTREALELAREIAAFASADGGASPGDGAEKERWQGFLEETTRKCLDVQRRSAETSLGGQDAEAWNNLGYFHVRTFEILRDPRRLEEAMAHLERALELDPVRPGPILNKIHVLHLMGRPQEAESLRATMRQRFPQDPRFLPPQVPQQGQGGPAPAPGPTGPPPGRRP